MFKKEKVTITDKTVSKLGKNAAKLITISTNPRIGLKNSPPYLPSIVAETQSILNKVFDINSLDLLRENLYINLFVEKFDKQCAKTLKLFVDAKKFMEDANSDYRRVLSKLTLTFSHALGELKGVFPEGLYNEEYTIVKLDAREFWETSFGKSRSIVTWEEFETEFGKVQKFVNNSEPLALKRTIDLTENGHVSRFEFDVFTRLFQPWKQILNNWNVIVCYHPGYQAFMTYDEVESTLQRWKTKPGSYVFRLSCTRLGQWAIGFVTAEGKIVQTIPQSKSLYQALIDGMEEHVYVYPNGEDTNPDIRTQIRHAPEDHIQVSKEQYDIYCDIDTTFETCKICDDRIKDMRLEPCGHLICNVCLASIFETNAAGQESLCPWCREKIKATEPVVIDPWTRKQADEHNQQLAVQLAAAQLAATQLASAKPPEIPSRSARRSLSGSGPATVLSTSLPLSTTTTTTTNSNNNNTNNNTNTALLRAPPLVPRAGADVLRRSSSVGDNDSGPALPDRSYPTDTLERRGDRRSLLLANDSSSSTPVKADADCVQRLMALGFPSEQVHKALVIAHNNMEMAANILCQFSSVGE